MAKTSTLRVTDWATQTQFNLPATGASIANGDVTLQTTSEYPGVNSITTYDLTESSVSIELVSPPNVSNGSTQAALGVRVDNNGNYVYFDWGNGAVGGSYYVGGTGNWGPSIPYDPVAHKYFRIRESGGTVYWETSPDTVTWTQIRSSTVPLNLSAVTVYANSGNWNAATNPGSATFGEVNHVPAAPEPNPEPEPSTETINVKPWSSVTLTGSGTGSWSQSLGTSVVLGGSGNVRTFMAPPSMSAQTLQFTFGSNTTTVNIERASHGIKQSDGTVKPFRFSRRDLANLITYTGTDALIANPERGWYQYTETRWNDAAGTGFTALNQADIVNRRTTNETINGYSVPPRSIVFRYYIMKHMQTVDTLPAAFLTALQNDLNTVRNAGAKMLIRFCYSDDGTTGSNAHTDGPYGTDTTVARTLGHVSQLKSTMNANADVIHAVQAGFIGTWGEWYYTDYWGNKGTLTTTDWNNRAQLISALLDWNVNIPVLLRYVGLKRRYMREAGIPANAGDRLGFHNDAFQASPDDTDWGTFNTFADGMSVVEARAYLATEVAKGLPMVGETAGVSTRSTYAATSASLAEHRWSALNPNYHPDVLASWSSTDKDEVSRKLGYRLRLVSLSLPTSGTANTGISIELTIANDGWGNPLSKRPMQIVFDDGTRVVKHTLAKDIRTLGPGVHTISESVLLPAYNGSYDMYLAMPDLNPSLADRPEYAIRVANTTGWANGRNSLGLTVTITGEAVALMTPDTSDPGTFTTTILADTNDPGTFEAVLTPDPDDPGTFLLAGSSTPTTPTRLKPTSATQAQMDSSVQTLWTNWKTNIDQKAENGWYAVRADAQEGANPYVAEGQGYGLLAAVQMSDVDSGAKTIFDGITKFVLDHPSSINPDLHAAEQDANMVSHNGGDSATDGDMDIAYAHLLAHKKWGSAGAYNYLQLATTRINAIKQSIISPVTGLLELGDWSSGTWENYSRPSDWMIGHFEAFYAATGDATWETAKNAHLSSVQRLQSNYAPATGLLPDFTQNPPATIAPAGPNLLESVNDGDYYYNACRTPWRLGVATSQTARDASSKMATWAKTKCNGNPSTLPSGYKLDGTTITGSEYQDLSFISPFAVGATCGTDQAWLNSLWDYMAAQSSNTDYYSGSIQLLCMIQVAGTYVINP